MPKCTQRNQFLKTTPAETCFQKNVNQTQLFRQIMPSLQFLHIKSFKILIKDNTNNFQQSCRIIIIQNNFVQTLQFRRVSQVINDPSPDIKQFPDVNKKNMSVCVNSRIEKYKIHLDMIENQNPIQIPHLSIKTPQKYPPILSSKILPSTKRFKTDLSEGTQIYKISNHSTIQSVRDRQQKLVKNIQSLIQLVNSSRDEKLCKLFDKLKHDLDLDDIKLENE